MPTVDPRLDALLQAFKEAEDKSPPGRVVVAWVRSSVGAMLDAVAAVDPHLLDLCVEAVCDEAEET